jgi:hypothetical protein
MARPRKGQEKHATERVAFRIPSWVRAGIDRLSAECNASLSDIANEALVAYLKRHGVTPPPLRGEPRPLMPPAGAHSWSDSGGEQTTRANASQRTQWRGTAGI